MYLVTQEPEDHHSGQVPLQALGFLRWGPACPAEKVSKPFAFLRRGICVNVNLYLTNGILSRRMYQYLMIYYKCFHQVINAGPWQKAKGLCREQGGGGKAGPVALCPGRWWQHISHPPQHPCGHQESLQTRQPSQQQSLLPAPTVLSQTLFSIGKLRSQLC